MTDRQPDQQDITHCTICGGTLDHEPKLGEWIAHQRCAAAVNVRVVEAMQRERRIVTREIVAWLRDVAYFVNDEMSDPERIEKGIDPHWCVDPTDTRDLADAIERGEHQAGGAGCAECGAVDRYSSTPGRELCFTCQIRRYQYIGRTQGEAAVAEEAIRMSQVGQQRCPTDHI